MNTVGPYHNRQETYGYFTLPFCAGPKESISHYHETLGEALQAVWSFSMSRTFPRSCYGVSYAIKNQLLPSKAPY